MARRYTFSWPGFSSSFPPVFSSISTRAGTCALLAAMLALAGCGGPEVVGKLPGAPKVKPKHREPGVPDLPPAGSGRGAYYKDDGPGDEPPPNLLQTPDAEVRNDPPLPRANRPYTVFGTTYEPIPHDKPYTARGLGTWYGKKFHGQRTSSGELYDMYKMSAAHPTLPIPSYARVTNLSNGKSVVVRINDRGPFKSSRVIDVSYTAALKLGLLLNGSSELEVTRLMPDEIDKMVAARKAGVVIAAVEGVPVSALRPGAPLLASAGPDELEDFILSRGTAADTAAPSSNGFYLQLGAYAKETSAAMMRERVASATRGSEFSVVQVGPLYRLYGGPFGSREEAAAAAARLPTGLRLKPLIVQREIN
ncbi:septal ring lytic transglycosylase RlpA family protein [Pseudoduganella sp. SL102]|uniref:septal ring lytic transglycosylase RlpA family protein n=1 Tax=Pseudoduganella sp. SL102 TaxID=2995154 RepID=UPI00248CDE4F|nr:septal ring lytic transglycosylase RlpA family protein [Pseudoduganella sp. SL102]WBS03793.1 septal ring lytic transglycosylase RlpA family protein [Pseudoduganella sp. SL102]